MPPADLRSSPSLFGSSPVQPRERMNSLGSRVHLPTDVRIPLSSALGNRPMRACVDNMLLVVVLGAAEGTASVNILQVHLVLYIMVNYNLS